MPEVVELNLGVIPSPAGSGELLFTDEQNCALVFIASAAGPPPGPVGVVTLHGCQQVVFGYPNDTGQPGHPLYAHGGWSYGFYEVLGSDWSARLEGQNRVARPDTTGEWTQRHFLIACHEDLIEALADDISVEVFPLPFRDVAAQLLSRFLDDE